MLDKDGKFKKGTVYVSCRWPACAKGDGFRGYPKAWQVNGRLTLAAFKTNHTARHCPAMKILENLSPEELRQLAEAPLTESLALSAAAAQKIAAKGQAEEAGGAAGGDEASGGSIKPISLSSSPVKGATGSVAFTVGPETVHACYLGPTFLERLCTKAIDRLIESMSPVERAGREEMLKHRRNQVQLEWQPHTVEPGLLSSLL